MNLKLIQFRYKLKFNLQRVIYRVRYIFKREDKLRCKNCNSTKIRMFNSFDTIENDKPRRYVEAFCKKCGSSVRMRQIWESKDDQLARRVRILKERNLQQ